jgi:TctA family transporter
MDFSAMAQGFLILMEPMRLFLLLVGVVMGLIVGLLPGLGGVTAMALLLPFVTVLDPYTGLAMLIGVSAVINTSDTFPSVMMGIPGSSGSQATIMDGYPLARQGLASKALSAALIASLAGGLIGALVLTLIIPLARPFVLGVGSPEMFALAIFGLSMVGALSGTSLSKGLISAAGGFLLGAIGADAITGTYRFTFDVIYLFDGIPLTIVALGLFALPEIADVLMRGGAISERGTVTGLGRGWVDGIRAAIHHRWLIVRHALIGVLTGMTPGLGGAVVDWLNYGIVVQLSKDKKGFGSGDIRGVIAPESSNNAKDGGSLIPTLLFGVPGSASMALLLSAMAVLNVQPGPRLLESNMPMVFVIIWSLALANVFGALICIGLTRPIVRLTLLPFKLLAPGILVLISLAAFQASRQWGDLIALLALAILGWGMKKIGMPRPPLLIGFILSLYAERYLFISTMRYGWEWLLRPGVVVVGTLTILVIVGTLIWQIRSRRSTIARAGEAVEG